MYCYCTDEDSSTAIETVGRNSIIYYSLSTGWCNKSAELAMIDCPVKNLNKLSTTGNLDDPALHGRSQESSRLPLPIVVIYIVDYTRSAAQNSSSFIFFLGTTNNMISGSKLFAKIQILNFVANQ